ncbi:hypothetical protein FA15DRAFT_710051 [Coprinopsis marcescibilis]|uniref:Nephrocystin 3-like N-terminal domain-containing protein n=1 Tax=Coprinopsis marcescibilis TaxID=230819 RepID=A0A5C3KEA4_COPMA|nr:hypothetical protein FA15DRAFT_710051 [Coprinopsis marcescibilis]
MLKTILASPRDGVRAGARTGIGDTKKTDTTPGSSTPSRLWKSLKGSLRGQRSTKAGLEMFSKSSHVTLNDVSINAHAADRLEIHYHNSATGIKLHEALRRLPDPQRCNYDVMRICSKGTRVVHLEEISSWATRSVDSSVSSEHAERVLVVGGPAGSGKSALAHTICKRMHDSGLLVASFFSHTNQELTSEDFMAVFIRGLYSINPQIEQGIGQVIVENPALASSPAITQFEGLVIPIIPLLPTDRTFVVGIDALDEQSDRVLVAFLRDYVPRLPATFKFVLTTRPVPQVMEHLEGQPHCPYVPPFAGRWIELSRCPYSEGLFLWAETVLNHIDNSYDPPTELADIVKGASSHWMESQTSTKKLESLYAHILSKLPWTDYRFVEKYNVVMGAFVALMEPLSVLGLTALYTPDGITEEDIHRICGFIRPLLQDYSRDTPRKPVQLLHLSVQEFLTRNAPPPYHIDINVPHPLLSRLSLLTIKTELVPTNVPTLGFTEGDWVWNFTESPPGIPRLSKDVVLEHLWYACCHLGQHELSVLKVIADKSHGALLYEVVVEDPRYLLEASASMGALIDIVSLQKKAVRLYSVQCTSENTSMTIKSYFAMACCLYPQDRSLGLMEEAVRLHRQSIQSLRDPSTELEYSAGLVRLAELLYTRLRSSEGLRIAEEALAITRRLTSASHTMASPVLGSALLLQSRILCKLQRSKESHEMDLKAINTFRELAAAQSGIFCVHLAMALYWTGKNLIIRKRHNEATIYIQESAKLHRWLARSNPDKHEPHLARVLLECGYCLAEVGKPIEAVPLGEEAVVILKRRLVKDPSYLSPDLAHSLYWLAWYLFKCGRHGDALLPSTESLHIRRSLAEADPAAYESALSDSLHGHALYLSMSPTTSAKSIACGQEAVQIRRRLGCEDPHSFDAGLAQSLFNLACNLGNCSRYSEAVSIAKECVDIRRRLAEAYPAVHEASLASSLHNYAFYLSKSPITLAESIEPGQEAVEIRRRLARKDPQTFYTGLAQSLDNLACDLDNCSRHSEAVPIAKECTEIRRSLVEGNPERYEPSLASSLYNYAIYLSKSPTTLAESIEPGQESVNIRRRLACEDPQSFDADFAQSLFTLAYTLDQCSRDREAVPITKECVDIRRRLAEGDPAAHEASLADSLYNYAFYLSKSPATLVESIEPGQEAVEIRRRLACKDPQAFDAGLAQSLFNLTGSLDSCNRHSEAIPLAKEYVDIRRRLAEGDPGTYEASQASSLYNYAFYLSKSPITLAESIEPGQEAVKIRRRLARKDPQTFYAGLAQSLNNLACDLGNCSRHSEAVPIAKECVDIRRRLAEENPAAYEASLASSLHNHAVYLSKSSSTLPESIEPGKKAVDIRRRLAREDPQRVDADLAQSLYNLACNLANCSRYGEAVPLLKDCVETRRRLTERDCADTHEPLLAWTLNKHACYLAQIPGRAPEAVKPAEESVLILHRLALDDPKAFSNDLVASLDTMAYSLNHCGRYEDALPPALEGLEIYRKAIEEEAYGVSDHQSSSLHKTYAKSLVGLGRDDEATVPLKSAIIIYERLVSAEPEDASYSLELQECRQLLEKLSGGSTNSI